ncbi:MAG: hypothetical protein AAB839_02175 [Patescibacteria group bacterium]
MKNLTRAALASAVALSVGVAVLPATTFAASSSDVSAAGRSNPDHRRGPGVVGEVTAVTQNGDGTGTITLTIAKPPVERPNVVRHLAQNDDSNIPDAGSSIVIAYTSETKFSINGEESSAANLAVGTTVRVVAGRAGDELLPAKIVTTDVRKPADMKKHRGFMGIVSAIDATANTMTVQFAGRNERPATTVTVVYSDSTKFVKSGETSNEAAVTVGATVQFNGTLSADSGTVKVSDVTRINLK